MPYLRYHESRNAIGKFRARPPTSYCLESFRPFTTTLSAMLFLQCAAGKLDKPKRWKALTMHTSTLVRPVNSLIFVSDRAGGRIPLWQKNKQVLWTDSCISVACYPEQDGPTELSLGASPEVDPGFRPEFDGILKMPNRIVTVQDVTHVRATCSRTDLAQSSALGQQDCDWGGIGRLRL